MARKKYTGVAVIAVIIIVVAVVASLAILSGAVGISGPTKLTLTSTPTVVKLQGGQYVLLLSKTNPSSDTAYILIGKSPIFVSQTLNVTLLLDNFTKVNAGTTYANMEVYLDAVTSNSVSVTLTPLQTYLDEQPDSGRIVVVSASAYSTTSVTISVQSTTISTSTTINSTQSAEQRIIGLLKNNLYYPLMANYTTDYANTASCTGDLYNSSYILHYTKSPYGPFTYQNITAVTPYLLARNITNVGNGDWAVVYSTVSQTSRSTGPALTITMNLTSGLPVNTIFSGAWQGQSYDSLMTGLSDAAIVGNACGILVV